LALNQQRHVAFDAAQPPEERKAGGSIPPLTTDFAM